MRESLACAAARWQVAARARGRIHHAIGKIVAPEAALRVAHRLALGVADPFAELAHAARAPSDDLVVARHDRPVGLIAGRDGLVAHGEGRGDEFTLRGGACA